MTAVTLEPQPWEWRRRLGMIALVFIVQLALIFWLGSRKPITARPPGPSITLKFADKRTLELGALNDPTLFTLGHPRQIPGPAPIPAPSPELHSFDWSAPTNQPLLPLDQVGTAFTRLMETSHFEPLRLPIQSDAAPTLPTLLPLALPMAHSALQLEGALAERPLLTQLQLQSQSNADILTNTVLQVGIDAEGMPASVTLLLSSGSPAADQYGLDQAWAARFQPAKAASAGGASQPSTQISWGKMIFRWHTVALPQAAAPAVSP